MTAIIEIEEPEIKEIILQAKENAEGSLERDDMQAIVFLDLSGSTASKLRSGNEVGSKQSYVFTDIASKIVQKFDEKFPFVDIKSNIVNCTEAVADFRLFITTRMMTMNIANACNRFSNVIGKFAHNLHASLGQLVYFFL